MNSRRLGLSVVNVAAAILSASLISCGSPIIEGALPGECVDSIDNDEDGLIDCADPDCITRGYCDGDITETGFTIDTGGPEICDPCESGTDGWIYVSAGEETSCGIRPTDLGMCWGDPSDGQADIPQDVAFSQLDMGWDHGCGVDNDGLLHCWGENFADKATPPNGSYTYVSVGKYNSCAVKTTGDLVCWGSPEYGMTTPPQGAFESVSVGFNHACAVASDGSVECWGESQDGKTTAATGSYSAVATGATASCGLSMSGSILCWGSSTYGQTNPPQGVYTAIDMSHTGGGCALDTDGVVACWGELHDEHGAVAAVDTPDEEFTAIDVGPQHACGLTTDGSIVCWGSNESGKASAP